MNLVEVCEKAVKAALKYGATEAEAVAVRDNSTTLRFSEGIDSFKSYVSTFLGVRAVIGKRIGIYGVTSLADAELAAKMAVNIAKASPEDKEWHSLARGYGSSPVEKVFDEAIAKMEPEGIVEMYSRMRDATKEVKSDIKITEGGVSIGTVEFAIANSYGESNYRQGTNISAGISVRVEEAGKVATAGEWDSARMLNDISVDEVAVEAAHRAIDFLNAKPIPSGKTDVIVRGKVFAQMLYVMLSGPLSAEWVQQGRSPLKGKLGEKIASENFTIIDDGVMPLGMSTKPFDDEGLPTRKKVVIDRGVLKTFLYDFYTASKEGKESTGNASRGPYSPPRPSPTNLYLAPGDADEKEIMAETRKGLYVVDIIGGWLSNPVSGYMTMTVTHGYLVENGELTGKVKGIIVAGNFYEVIKGQLDLIGKKLHRGFGAYSPTVRIRELNIAGKK